MEGPLEAVQDGIQGNAFLDGAVGVFHKAMEEGDFIVVVERVHDFVCEPHESVHRLNGRAELGGEHADAQAERGAVSLGRQGAAGQRDMVKQRFARVQQFRIDRAGGWGHGRHAFGVWFCDGGTGVHFNGMGLNPQSGRLFDGDLFGNAF